MLLLLLLLRRRRRQRKRVRSTHLASDVKLSLKQHDAPKDEGRRLVPVLPREAVDRVGAQEVLRWGRVERGAIAGVSSRQDLARPAITAIFSFKHSPDTVRRD